MICLFEDRKVVNFYPLTLTRPIYELRCGVMSLQGKIHTRFSQPLSFHCRDYLTQTLAQRAGKNRVNQWEKMARSDLLLINGRVLLFGDEIPLEGEEELGIQGEDIVYARLRKETMASFSKGSLRDIEVVLIQAMQRVRLRQVEAKLVEFPWDLVDGNREMIRKDFEIKDRRGIEGKVDRNAHLINPDLIYIGKGATVEAGVVLDASEGPIYIEEGVRIRPPTIVDGPSYIGRETTIDGAKIRGGCSIGPVCRIAGEIEESIIHGYTNKHHEGFIGHSYIGEWVNLGALTTTSDLKNTYGTVKVCINGKEIDTGKIKVGCFIGDHTKTGIGTLLDTGCVMGVAVNLFGGGRAPKFIPSFSWGGGDELEENRLDKVLEVARIVMERRGIQQTRAQRDLLKKVYQLTLKERKRAKVTRRET